MDKAILVLNAGSSTIKSGIFAPGRGGAHVNENLRDMQIDCRSYAHEHGIDKPQEHDWVWPY